LSIEGIVVLHPAKIAPRGLQSEEVWEGNVGESPNAAGTEVRSQKIRGVKAPGCLGLTRRPRNMGEKERKKRGRHQV